MTTGWSLFVIILTIANILACFWLLRWPSKPRKAAPAAYAVSLLLPLDEEDRIVPGFVLDAVGDRDDAERGGHREMADLGFERAQRLLHRGEAGLRLAARGEEARLRLAQDEAMPYQPVLASLEAGDFHLLRRWRNVPGMAGLVSAPEERLGHAAAPDMSLVENALLSGAVRKGLTRRGP